MLDEFRSKRQTKKLLENREIYIKTAKNCGNMHKKCANNWQKAIQSDKKATKN